MPYASGEIPKAGDTVNLSGKVSTVLELDFASEQSFQL